MYRDVAEFWTAAKNFRAAQDQEEKHKARVSLLRLALKENNLGNRAAAILLTEGIKVVRAAEAISAVAGLMGLFLATVVLGDDLGIFYSVLETV